MSGNSRQTFGTGFLVLTALAVILLNVSLITDLHVYSQPACVPGDALGAAGVLTDVSQGYAPGVCRDN